MIRIKAYEEVHSDHIILFAVRVQSTEQVEYVSVKGSVTSPPVESLVDYPCLEECLELTMYTESEIPFSDDIPDTLSPQEFTYAGYPRTTLMGTAALKKHQLKRHLFMY